MSKFNQSNKGINMTTNKSGHSAYKMADKEKLVTAVLTTMLGEPKYYGSTDSEIFKLATECAASNPEFLSKLACYARNVANLRSVSHLLTCIVAHDANKYTRVTVRNVVVRPDDVLEIMACYKALYGKPFPNALKREVGEIMQGFNEYQLGKYNGNGKSMRFRDVLRITHPTPKNKEIEELFSKVINDTLATPYTWETELSARGNTKEVWNELIASGKLGYMAMLRNLKNMINAGADINPVLAVLGDEKAAQNSKQLPFRFYAAYKRLTREGVMTREIRNTLDKALMASAHNLPTLKGRTLIAIDVSGSMGSPLSRNSEMQCADVAKVIGCMASRICEDAVVVYFSSSMYGKSGITVEHYGKHDSVIDSVENAPRVLGGTDMSLPMLWAINTDTANKPFDRIIYLSDNECNCGKSTVQRYVDQYKHMFNVNPWVHAVDMEGYGTQQFYGNRFNLIAGWSDSVLELINIAEQGFGSIVDAVDRYEYKK
jgi:hypothetical protein